MGLKAGVEHRTHGTDDEGDRKCHPRRFDVDDQGDRQKTKGKSPREVGENDCPSQSDPVKKHSCQETECEDGDGLCRSQQTKGPGRTGPVANEHGQREEEGEIVTQIRNALTDDDESQVPSAFEPTARSHGLRD